MEKSEDNEVLENQNGENYSTKGSIHNSDEKFSEVSPPRKRGRKSKSEASETPQESTDQNETVTKRGRKRKSVNYFALANPDLGEIIDERVETRPLKKENSQRKSLRITGRKSSISSRDTEKENLHDEIEVNETHSLAKQNEDIEGATTNVGVDNDTSKRKSSDAEELTIDKLDEDQEYEIHVEKKKVYRRTGTTTNLMNTLFSQADFKVDTSDTKVVSQCVIKRGRPSKSSKKKNVQTDDNIFASQTTVTCAVCKKDIEKNGWSRHKQRYHNNLAWRIGEPALDLNNLEFVQYTLNALYLAKVPFHCDICDKSLKSVQGFLSHKSVCGKETEDVKVACEKCGRKMLPVSMPSHMRLSHENKDRMELVPKKQSSTIVRGSRRQAAEKALKVIKEFNSETSELNTKYDKYIEDLSFISSKAATEILQNQIETLNRVQCKYPDCNFECFTAEDIKNHLKFCVKKPDNGYVCKDCMLVQLNIADIANHIESVHKVVVEKEKETEEKPYFVPSVRNRPTKQNKNVNIVEKDKLQKKVPKFLLPLDKEWNIIFCKAYKWTLKFCAMNYSKVLPEEHFRCLKSDWDYMNIENAEEYLPQMPYSCDVGFETVSGFQNILQKDHTFRKFELFESYLENNGNSTIFCGGPITALSWLPTPHECGSVHQVVAVATRPHPDAQYETDVNYNEKCFIQFWDVGPLRNTDTSLFRPKQAFCLQFDHGPVWDLQWCPSNCFDLSEQPDDSEKLRRLGVLAVAGSDSYVYIYSIPNFRESGQFYNARPVLVLIRNFFEEEKLRNKDYYATRISWTKASGHRYLAVGYSNGQVAIYDLWSDSRLLRCKTDDDIDVLTPYTVLDGHSHSITAITLHHSHGGCRWLMTGSFDRTVRTWDLKEKRCVRTLKTNLVNDAVWMTHWMCYIIGYDEATNIGNTCSGIHQCKDGLSDPLYLFHCSSAITSLSTSDWLNGIIQANSVGEIFATFPKQLMVNLNWKYAKHNKLLFGYTTLVEKDKSIEERLKVNNEKQKALRNQLKVKTKITTKELPSDREVMHLDYNPHYFEYEPLVYHEMDEKYGLIFCDHKMKKWSDFPKNLRDQLSHSSEKYSPSRPNMYPLQSITKIRFNMNRQASTYYVSGYQAGFIRLTYMKFLEDDPYVHNDSVNIMK